MTKQLEKSPGTLSQVGTHRQLNMQAALTSARTTGPNGWQQLDTRGVSGSRGKHTAMNTWKRCPDCSKQQQNNCRSNNGNNS